LPPSQRWNSLLCLHQGAPLPSLSVASDACAPLAGAGGDRSRAISDRISANICRDTATSAIEPDEHGVFDGREMARQLIGNAYRVLVPYVSGCPACTDNLFGVIANRTIEEIHQPTTRKAAKPGSTARS